MKIKISDLQNFLTIIEENNFTILEAIRLIKSNETNLAEKEFKLIVDYSRTLQEMIKAGNYDWVDNSINEKHFFLPIELLGKKITVCAKLVHFNRSISSQDAITELSKSEPQFRLATLAEQLAFAEANPELQKQFPIVSLGSVWRNIFGSRSVPVLLFDDYERWLSLDSFVSKWSAYCRFLVVRKLSLYS